MLEDKETLHRERILLRKPKLCRMLTLQINMNNYTCVPLTSIDRHKKSSKDILGFFFFQNMAQYRHDANVQSEKLNNFINSNVTIVAWFLNYFILRVT